MYSRSRMGRNIWDDGRVHIPPGYKGNAFRSSYTNEVPEQTEGKIHPPEQKLDTAQKRQHSVPYDSDEGENNAEFTEENAGRNQQDTIEENLRKEEANTKYSLIKGIENHENSANFLPNNHSQLSELLTGLFHSLGREEWLLILVIVMLLADGSDAWDIILLLLLLLGVH